MKNENSGIKDKHYYEEKLEDKNRNFEFEFDINEADEDRRKHDEADNARNAGGDVRRGVQSREEKG